MIFTETHTNTQAHTHQKEDKHDFSHSPCIVLIEVERNFANIITFHIGNLRGRLRLFYKYRAALKRL